MYKIIFLCQLYKFPNNFFFKYTFYLDLEFDLPNSMKLHTIRQVIDCNSKNSQIAFKGNNSSSSFEFEYFFGIVTKISHFKIYVKYQDA